MHLELENKLILVTGGDKGIGKSIAKTLAAEGAIPFIIARNKVDIQNTCDEILDLGLQIDYAIAELTDTNACAAAIQKALTQYGRIEGLVNNAGVNDSIGLADGSVSDFRKSLERNLVHYYTMAHYALPALKKAKGHIVNIGSKVAQTGQGNTSGYAAANGGRNALAREWAVELLPFEIRINTVVVAECYTPLYQKWVNSLPNPDETLAEIRAKIPLGRRMTEADEIANTVCFLLSNRSSHTTGQIIYVDGGYTHLDRAIT